MCPCTSAPAKIKKRILGLDIILATTFSIPKFSVLHGPAIAAPDNSASMCEAKVVTATGLSGSPTM